MPGRVLVNGIRFADEEAAMRFDLDGVTIVSAGRDMGWLREFGSWEDAEAWAREGGGTG